MLYEGLMSKGINIFMINSKSFDSRVALNLADKQKWPLVIRRLRFWLFLIPCVIAENTLLFLRIIRNLSLLKKSALLLIPSYGNYNVFIVKLFSWIFKKPLILDAHGSLYYQRIVGQEDFQENSIYAKIIFNIDRSAALLCDKHMTLSCAYKKFLSNAFGVDEKKFMAVYVGTAKTSNQVLQRVSTGRASAADFLYWGSFKKFDGTIYFIKALAKLKSQGRTEIRAVFIGSGPERSGCIALAKKESLMNVEFPGWIEEGLLREYIQKSKICLGPFSTNFLGGVDLCNKICEAAAFGKTMIVGDSPAIRELFVNQESIVMCRRGDVDELARTMLYLLDQEGIRDRIGKNAFKVYARKLTPEAVASQFLCELGDLVQKK